MSTQASPDALLRLARAELIGLGASEGNAVLRMIDQWLHVTPPVSVCDVVDEVGDAFGVDPERIMGRGRRRACVTPRHVAMHLARIVTTQTLHDIARHFGRDHTTVLHADRKIKRERERDQGLDRICRELEARLRGGRE